MKISIQLNIDHENGDPAIIKPIAEFRRNDLTADTLGLTIEGSKILLKNIQFELIQQQIEQYIAKNKQCKQCNKERKIKGYNKIVYYLVKLNCKIQGCTHVLAAKVTSKEVLAYYHR